MAMIQCGFCNTIHPHTKLCRLAEKTGITKQQLISGEVNLQTGEISESVKNNEPAKASEIVKRNENRSQQYDRNAASRAQRWREQNPERYREYQRQYQREYQRKRRQRLRVDNQAKDS